MSLSHDWLLAGLFTLERLWKTKAFWFTWKLNNLPFFVLVTCWSAVLDRVPTMHLFTFSAELEQPQQTVTIRSKLSRWDFCRILSYGPGCRWQLIQILKCSFVCFRRGWLKIIQFWSRHEQESRTLSVTLACSLCDPHSISSHFCLIMNQTLAFSIIVPWRFIIVL